MTIKIGKLKEFYQIAFQRKLTTFSIARHHYKLAHQETEGTEKLRSLHAVKFCTCLLVVMGHVIIIFNVFPTRNPEYLEIVRRKVEDGTFFYSTKFIDFRVMLMWHQ